MDLSATFLYLELTVCIEKFMDDTKNFAVGAPFNGPVTMFKTKKVLFFETNSYIKPFDPIDTTNGGASISHFEF